VSEALNRCPGAPGSASQPALLAVCGLTAAEIICSAGGCLVNTTALSCSVCNCWLLRRVSAHRLEFHFDAGHVLSRSSRSVAMRQTSTLQVEQRFSAASVSAECTHPLILLFAYFECSECCSADGSVGNLTAGCGLVEDRLPRAVSEPVKSGPVSHRQVGLVAQLGKVELNA